MSQNEYLLIYYSCENLNSIIGLEIQLYDDSNTTVNIFQKKFKCSHQIGTLTPFENKNFKVNQLKVLVTLPAELRFRPDFLLTKYYSQYLVKIRLWMIDNYIYKEFKQTNRNDFYDYSRVRAEYFTKLNTPYKRPSMLKYFCLNFAGEIRFKLERKTIYKCDYQDGICFLFNLSIISLINSKLSN